MSDMAEVEEAVEAVEVPVTVLKTELRSMLAIVTDIRHIEVEYRSDPLDMANTAIERMRGRAVVLGGKIKGLLEK